MIYILKIPTWESVEKQSLWNFITNEVKYRDNVAWKDMNIEYEEKNTKCICALFHIYIVFYFPYHIHIEYWYKYEKIDKLLWCVDTYECTYIFRIPHCKKVFFLLLERSKEESDAIHNIFKLFIKYISQLWRRDFFELRLLLQIFFVDILDLYFRWLIN